MTKRTIRNGVRAVLCALTLSAVACEDLVGPYDIPDEDNPNLGSLEDNPTPSVIASTAQGLLEGIRSATEGQVSTPAHYGREGYYLAVARTVLDEFDEPLTPAGGIGWATAYTYIRTANSLRTALDKVGDALTPAQKEAVRGFAKTVEAYLLHGQIRVHRDFGIVIDTDRPRSGPLAPVASQAEAYSFILQRLDEAAQHLGNAGAAFPFTFTPGFAGFNTPSTFLRFNRALKARVLIETGDYAGALTALAASFIDPDGSLAAGVYNNYSTSSGDRTNPFYDPSGFNYRADTMLVVQAQQRPDGALDDRITAKTEPAGNYLTHTGVTSNLRWTLYPTNTSPMPVIKNEELILIRAEARLRTGDVAGAIADLNLIRTRSGGLAPLSGTPSEAALIDEIIYNRRYSLLYEYGHRWFDLRRFDRLGDLVGPRGAGDRVFAHVPLPSDECQARGGDAAGCTQVDGTRTTR